jgi:hypothetical protein
MWQKSLRLDLGVFIKFSLQQLYNKSLKSPLLLYYKYLRDLNAEALSLKAVNMGALKLIKKRYDIR